MKSFLVVALFVCASYAAILAHNDDGIIKDHDDNDGAVIEGQVLNLEERSAQCNEWIRRKTKRMKKLNIKNEANRTPFEIKKGEFKGRKVCCHRKCPQCGGNNCAKGEVMKDQDKMCCGKKIAEEDNKCEDQTGRKAGRNIGPCVFN